ncbi:hypothetical protein HFU84_11355 [Acidithiobacillus sp. CV18-2]|nr:hypothetical protein [Acidithiobacillus sp. CV18-3]MBU2757777.1 hypothetical protein [Acidithiobacillus sp. BN09-2]MBU2778091.1 hypothetical protein [Acidithiobacillus sp. CV18-2]MBU2798218.1 hypothetical protein [Acidithiobacillus sp. VAN18-4]
MTQSIDSHLNEERLFPVPETFAARAHLDQSEYQRLQAEAERDPEAFWGTLAREHLLWEQPFSRVLDQGEAPFYRWFTDGSLNVAKNCIDRHLQGAQM